jgi:peroxiredoxin
MMGKKLTSIALMMILLTTALTAAAANPPPQIGSVFPEMKLNKPTQPGELKYLGLSGNGTFSVSDVKVQAVIVQIFSMYCPYCQKDAPNVNRLFGLIENNPDLKGKIKIIGIGAGNSPFEVATFKKKYKVEFPLIPDADFKIHKIIGEVRTPYFMVLKMNSAKKVEVVYSKLGAQEDIEAFLNDIIKLADVK